MLSTEFIVETELKIIYSEVHTHSYKLIISEHHLLPVAYTLHYFIKTNLLRVAKLEVNKRVLAKDAVPDLLFVGLGSMSELLQLDFALAHRIITKSVTVHDLDGKLHVVKGGDVEVEGLVVHGVKIVRLHGRLHLTHVLVEERIVLLNLELDVRVGLTDVIFILDVDHWINVSDEYIGE